jgi:GDPmannose 4,6-dehydratase
MPRAFITGISGQDGSYLAELLLEKGCEVHGLVRRSQVHHRNLAHLLDDPAIHGRSLFLHEGDVANVALLRGVLADIAPDEVYHLAGQTHVGLSFEMAEATCELIAMGTLRLLEIIRTLPRPPRFFHASSSEIFGRPDSSPQDEQTPMRPINPYGCAKAFATQMVSIYRQRFGLFACNGILYNHESPRRGENFVTRKICLGAAAIKAGRQTHLNLGNTSARRDWGDARDYVRGMWLMMQQSAAQDFVLATGELHSVQEVAELAFGALGLDWKAHVVSDPALIRPDETFSLVGKSLKAQRLLNWQPKGGFSDLIVEMTLAAAESKRAG